MPWVWCLLAEEVVPENIVFYIDVAETVFRAEFVLERVNYRSKKHRPHSCAGGVFNLIQV
ncbi:MAG: hypothetical protein CMJ74_02350 [Planctomycetaceae bacterium]|nr:hypothetical protein [Planctomycetaceae bacterium]|tara:strand:+ start:8175 stop:8354 length:180 start_codon:yes stop_codon:yes gene_type:complete